jgi:ATP-dependent helicase HrpA
LLSPLCTRVGRLPDVLTRELTRTTCYPTPPGSWDLDAVPAHLRPTYLAVDDRGRPVAWSKDLTAMRRRLRDKVRAAVADAAPSIEETGLRTWTIGTLPRVVESGAVKAYPALVDEGDTVAVRAFPTEAEQERAMWNGTRRLLLLTLPHPPSTLQRSLGNDTKLALAAGPSTVAEVVDDCATAAVDELLVEAGGPVWDEGAFEDLQRRVRDGFGDLALDALRTAGDIAVAARDVEARIDRLTAVALQPSVADVRAQVDRLTAPGFVTDAGVRRLPDVLRYVRAAAKRLDKLPADPARDRRLMAQVHALEDDPRSWRARWLLEELRVSLFAQSLGTPVPVSEQRIRKVLAAT